MHPDRGQQRHRFDELADRAATRLKLARDIAASCRHDETVHRVAMKAVFVLEDTFFALQQIAEAGKLRAGRPPIIPAEDDKSG